MKINLLPTSLKALGIVIMLLAFLFVPQSVSARSTWIINSENMVRGTSNGFDQQGSNDGVSNIKTEVGTTRTASPLLVPVSDATPNAWMPSQPVICTPAGHWCRVADTPPHDGNVTYISGNPGTGATVTERFNVGDFTPASGVLDSIDSVTLYSWARINGTTTYTIQYSPQFEDTGVLCPAIISGVNQAFTNITNPTQVVACSGGAWTTTKVNSIIIWQACIDDGIIGAEPNCTLTATGIVVAYTYRNDFYVDFTTNWNNVRGTNWQLDYECTTTDAQQTFDITWAGTTNTAAVTCDGNQRNLFLSTSLAPGTATLQLTSSSTTGDILASTFSFDLLQLSSDIDSPPPPGGDGISLLTLVCDVGLKNTRCTVSYPYDGLGIVFTETRWFLNGDFKGVGEPVGESNVSHTVLFNFFAVGRTSLNVSVTVYTTTLSPMNKQGTFVYDSSALIFILIAMVIFLVVLILAFIARRSIRKQKRRDRSQNNGNNGKSIIAIKRGE